MNDKLRQTKAMDRASDVPTPALDDSTASEVKGGLASSIAKKLKDQLDPTQGNFGG